MPLTPAGIGVVEAGVVGVLTLVYDVPQTEALAITSSTGLISVLSIIVFGSIAYVVSPVRKGRGIVEAGAPRPSRPADPGADIVCRLPRTTPWCPAAPFRPRSPMDLRPRTATHRTRPLPCRAPDVVHRTGTNG